MRPDAERLIVHLDDDLAVIEKPAGLVVHSAPSHRGETLVDLLEGIAGGGEGGRPGIVHRLDKGTSGLMVVARNDESHRALARMVKAREVEREYTALVEGHLGSRTGTIDAPLGRHRRQRTKRAVKGTGSREARTHFEVIEELPNDTLVHARLETGRTHQIRVHFAAIDHPVAGDPEYGTRGRHGLKRQFLHASRLAFRHPTTGERLEFRSELPEDLRAALERASFLTPNVPECALGGGFRDVQRGGTRGDFAHHLQSRGLCTQPPPRGTGRCPGTSGFPQSRQGQHKSGCSKHMTGRAGARPRICGAPSHPTSDRKVRWPR